MAQGSLAGRRILLVEDEYFIASDLRRVLQGAGAEAVGPVGDLAAGLKPAQSEPLDAAFLNVNLEGDLSYQLADRLTDQNVPHAFVTGYDSWSIPEQYRDTSRITKPFAAASVVDVVAKLCGPGDRL